MPPAPTFDGSFAAIPQESLQDAMRLFGYYSSTEGGAILDHKNYTREIVAYLAAERYELAKILRSGGYCGLLEVGSGRGEAMDVCLALGIGYTGLDISASVRSVPDRAEAKFLPYCSFAQMSICELGKGTSPVPAGKRPLAFLPFNLVGNIEDPMLALRRIYESGLDVLVSCYMDDPAADAARMGYYRNCGNTNVRKSSSGGVAAIVSDQGLVSRTYTREMLAYMLFRAGFNTLRTGLLQPIGSFLYASFA